MSGILFLIEVVAFVLLAYWAFRNDKIGLTEGGTGLFAMRDLSAPVEPKSRSPKWKKGLKSSPVSQSPAVAGELPSGQKPQWAQKLPAVRRRF